MSQIRPFEVRPVKVRLPDPKVRPVGVRLPDPKVRPVGVRLPEVRFPEAPLIWPDVCDALAALAAWRSFAAMRRASSRVSSLAAAPACPLLLEINKTMACPLGSHCSQGVKWSKVTYGGSARDDFAFQKRRLHKGRNLHGEET
jgi:hypothetical protein